MKLNNFDRRTNNHLERKNRVIAENAVHTPHEILASIKIENYHHV